MHELCIRRKVLHEPKQSGICIGNHPHSSPFWEIIVLAILEIVRGEAEYDIWKLCVQLFPKRDENMCDMPIVSLAGNERHNCQLLAMHMIDMGMLCTLLFDAREWWNLQND